VPGRLAEQPPFCLNDIAHGVAQLMIRNFSPSTYSLVKTSLFMARFTLVPPWS
jgi:hypothetical protein